MKRNATLTEELNLSENKIGDEGARLINEGLKVNSTLTMLNLENNDISDEVIESLDIAK